MRFGLSTHLFHGVRLERDHLAAVAGAGFELVELFATRTHVDYHDTHQVETVRAWLDDLGLVAWSVHAPITDSFGSGLPGRQFSSASRDSARQQEALRETRAAIAAARRLGARVVVQHLGVPSGKQTPPDGNDATAARRSLESVAEACTEAGVQLAIEVIPNALSTPPAVHEWLRSDLDLGTAGACLDTGHAHMAGGVIEAIELLSGDIVTTHLHDNRGQSDDHLLPFGGTIDWPASLAALYKVGYGGPLIFELPDHGDMARTLARAAATRLRFQAILDELAAPFPFDAE